MAYPSQVTNLSTASFPGETVRRLDYTQNGVWWTALAAGGALSFWRSTTNGDGWTRVSSMDRSDVVGANAFFIDKDDFFHLLYTVDGGNGPSIRYRRGTPTDATRTSYNWSSSIVPYGGYGSGNLVPSHLSIGYGPGLDIIAFKDGTSYQIFFTLNLVTDGPPNPVVFQNLLFQGTMTSGGSYSQVNGWLGEISSPSQGWSGLDFRHEANDDKAVQAATPSVYWAYFARSASNDLQYRKINYSGGVWSDAGQVGIDFSTQSQTAPPSMYYDGTRIVIASVRSGDDVTPKCWERDEAHTTTTARDPTTALSDGPIGPRSIGYDGAGNIHYAVVAQTSRDVKRAVFSRAAGTWGGWTTIFTGTAGNGGGEMSTVRRKASAAAGGVMPVIFQDTIPAPDTILVDLLSTTHSGEASLQVVGTVSPDANIVHGAEALLQGVATFVSDGAYIAGADAALQGVARLVSEAEGVPFLDFTVYDCYIEALGDTRGLIFYEESKPETTSIKLQPTKQDVGNNPEEIRPEFGNFFAQADFSHGAGQRYFHQPGRDARKYWHSEGFDISEPGKLIHLHPIAEARDSVNIGRLEQVGDLPFVINGTAIDRGNGSWPGAWTAEDPSAADADQTVHDLAAEGARLFAATNTATASVRVRSSAGTWTRFQPDGATDLNVGTATRLAWVKNRLMVVGGTNSRSIYEIAASSAPVAIETLPEGWTFEAIFEAGGFIHACAVNTAASLSRVHHYGLNTAGSAIEKKSSTPFPQGQLMYTGCGFPGLAFVAGGVFNASGGYDPILYRAAINETRGELEYIEVRQEEGAGSADLSCRALVTMGETILAGWSVGSATYGGARDGIAVYHVARDAFAYHLRKTAAGANQRVIDIMPFKGRVLVSIQGDGLYYEDLSAYVTSAVLVTSSADWNNAGQKVWDSIEISHDPLLALHAFVMEYSIETFSNAMTWSQAFTSDDDDSTSASGSLATLKARQFALKINSTVTAAATSNFLGYSVRSLPAPGVPEYQLTRYVRLIGRDRKDEDATVVYIDPQETLKYLQDSIYSVVNLYESGFAWTAWLEDVSTVEPNQPFYEITSGQPLKDVFVVRLQMTGSR